MARESSPATTCLDSQFGSNAKRKFGLGVCVCVKELSKNELLYQQDCRPDSPKKSHDQGVIWCQYIQVRCALSLQIFLMLKPLE